MHFQFFSLLPLCQGVEFSQVHNAKVVISIIFFFLSCSICFASELVNNGLNFEG
jgi:hypothetical protein